MRTLLNISAFILLVLVVARLASAETQSTPSTQAAPTRIVSVGGALTEIVYALNAADKLVGVDTTSQYPETATQLPQVGYQRQLSAEGVLSLKPDVILLTEEAGPPAVLEQIKAAGIKVITLPAEHSVEGVIKKIHGVAEAVGKVPEGEAMILEFKRKLSAAQQALPQTNKPNIVFLLNVGGGSPMAAGRNTAANAMIALAGGNNAFGDTHDGYKPVSSEAMIAANPGIILLTKDTLDTLGGIDKAVAIPGVALTDAGKNKRIVTLDSLYLLGFGPRLPEAVQELGQLLHKGQ